MDCKRSVTQSVLSLKVTFHVKHENHHSSDKILMKMDKNVMKTKVLGMLKTRMTPFQIMTTLRSDRHAKALYSDVYNLWSELFSNIYKRENDPHASAIKYIQECDTMQTIYVQNNPFGLGILTEIGLELTDKYSIKELFIDSTFKTNSEKLEMFAFIAPFLGSGFPNG